MRSLEASVRLAKPPEPRSKVLRRIAGIDRELVGPKNKKRRYGVADPIRPSQKK